MTTLISSVTQSELPLPIPWNQSDLRCTFRIYFDNVTLTLLNVMLTSQKPCQLVIAAKQIVINEVMLLFLCPQRNFGRHIVIALSVRPSVCPSRFRVRSISPIFFEVGIPNLVCGYILGWGSVAYHFRVTVTLTSDLVFRIIVSGAYLLYYLR